MLFIRLSPILNVTKNKKFQSSQSIYSNYIFQNRTFFFSTSLALQVSMDYVTELLLLN